jgi:hypothetical protein
MAKQSVRTIDHQEIRDWAEARGGEPAIVADTGGAGGLLRIDFGTEDEALEPVSWSEFFRIFDEHDLAFVYEQEPDGVNFTCVFVSRADEDMDGNDDMVE